MTNNCNDRQAFLHGVLNAIPSFVFVVDEDVRIEAYNRFAETLLGPDPVTSIRRRGGEALHCLHAFETPEGCGHSPDCAGCVVRNSIKECQRGGQVVRHRFMMELRNSGKTTNAYVLISASPLDCLGENRFLLIIEELTQLLEAQSLIPICAKCKKIRDTNQAWKPTDTYFREHWDLRFTHGLCPDCSEEMLRSLDLKFNDPKN